jgi:hypothetical protein
VKRLVLPAVLALTLGLALMAPPASASPPFHCNQVNLHPNGPLAAGQVGMSYSQSVWLTPANAFFYLWSTSPSPAFPGVSIVPSGNSALLTGTPTTAGTYTFTVTGGGVYVLGAICNLTNTYTVTVTP